MGEEQASIRALVHSLTQEVQALKQSRHRQEEIHQASLHALRRQIRNLEEEQGERDTSTRNLALVAAVSSVMAMK
jgi:uncharacterized coiled-coil DUF342 family protein